MNKLLFLAFAILITTNLMSCKAQNHENFKSKLNDSIRPNKVNGPCTVHGNLRDFTIICNEKIEYFSIYKSGIISTSGNIYGTGNKNESILLHSTPRKGDTFKLERLGEQTLTGFDKNSNGFGLVIWLSSYARATLILSNPDSPSSPHNPNFRQYPNKVPAGKSLIHDLTQDLDINLKKNLVRHARPNEEDEHDRFQFKIQERFFFDHNNSEQFFKSIETSIVILNDNNQVIPLEKEKILLSLTPELLKDQLVEFSNKTLYRSFIEFDRKINNEYLADLHQYAARHLEVAGEQFFESLNGEETSVQSPVQPMIFYRQIFNEEGVQELKPHLYLPSKFLR